VANQLAPAAATSKVTRIAVAVEIPEIEKPYNFSSEVFPATPGPPNALWFVQAPLVQIFPHSASVANVLA
jgi:hypothetical protein